MALDASARTLRSGDLLAVFLPGRGMLGASLRHRGEELLGRVEDIASFAQSGRTCGIPLLHPWANRLSQTRYRAAGREVVLDPASPLIGHDAAALPMHGIPWPRLAGQVVDARLGPTPFDDGFALLDPQASFSLAGAHRRIAIELIDGYTHAQVDASPGQDLIAIAPMTAPANALVSGAGLRLVEPGGTLRAVFRIDIQPMQGAS